MDSGRELIEALTQVSQEKGIDKEVIIEAIESALVSACKKHYGQSANVRVILNRETGEYTVLATKNIVEEVTDEMAEITLKEAKKINKELAIDDTVEIEIKPGNFGRISAQTAKQVVVQKFREAERELIFNEFTSKQGKVVTAVVQRRDRRNVIVNLGRTDAMILPAEQIPRESYQLNDRIRVYIHEVKQGNKGPLINVSRAHPDLLKTLLEQEIPEISDGTVDIKAVAREAGNRSKVAVSTTHPNVDPIGACVGQNGHRINTISRELRGEKIDVIYWSQDPIKYIASALSPSKVSEVAVNPLDMAARVVVPDSQLSLAIGKEGQNARLAARLTGWRIDIKSESQAAGTDFLVFPELAEIEAAEETSTEMEAAYQEFYEEATEEAAETPQEETKPAEEAAPTEAPAAAEYDEYDDEYDDDYYDDEYDDEYDDYYDDDEYYDDEYDDEYYDEPAAGEETPPAK